MIDLTKVENIYLYTGTTDFRLRLNGLTMLILSRFGNRERLNNSLFVFCSKTRTKINIVLFEEGSKSLYQKHLEKGKFFYPDKGDVTKITKENLRILIE